MTKIEPYFLNLAGEYRVCSELSGVGNTGTSEPAVDWSLAESC